MASQEDDATELQFPKDLEIFDYVFSDNLNGFNNSERCSVCETYLEVPYIECITCLSVAIENGENFGKICLWCFAKGKEANIHKNDHDYIIKKQNFPLLSNNWQAKEELQLLNAIMEHGIGNWADISKNISNKSLDDCRKHYFDCYIENSINELDILFPTSQLIRPNQNYLINNSKNAYEAQNSETYQDIAGYNAARNDFAIEHLNDAEKVLSDVDPILFEQDEEPSLGHSLESAILDIYQNSLQERQLRKNIIKEHGIMGIYKSSIKLNYCRSHFPELSVLLPKLYALITHEELTYLIESFESQYLLKKQIAELQEYRHNGLKRNTQTYIYKKLNEQRAINLKRKQKLKFGPNSKEINIEELNKLRRVLPLKSSFIKRLSMPLNIAQEPYYHTLTEEEKRIASSMRILPKIFNYFKTTMIEECRKLNGLKLCHARLLFKIDVNKIRKIYDYLMKEGYIY